MKTKTMKLASRGKRFGAYCIDSLVPFIVSMVMTVMLIAMLAYTTDYYNRYNYGYGYSYGPSRGQIAGFIILFMMLIGYTVVQLFFFSKSMTIGKALLGMQVISAQDGKPIGFWKMLFREWFVKRASSSVFFLGYIWIIIDHKSRGWHDLILETYVIDVKESAKIQKDSLKETRGSMSDTSVPLEELTVIESVVTKSATELHSESKSEQVQEINIDSKPELSMTMTKDELLAIAKDQGLDMGRNIKKTDIIAAIEEKMNIK